MKSEQFETILQSVARVCEVSADLIKSRAKHTEVVYARTIFIWFCNSHGLCANDIAKYLGRKRKVGIYECIANFHLYRKSSVSFRLLAHEIEQELLSSFASNTTESVASVK